MPLTKIRSPGDSSQPASREPSITVSAPATSALPMSPEYCRPPSAISGTPAGNGGLGGLVDGGDLRDADAGHHAGGADGAGAHAHLDAVGTGVDQRLGAFAGGGLAADDVHVRGDRIGLQPADHVEHTLGVAVGGVDEEGVHAGVDQRHGALPAVAEEADGRADAQPAFVVLGGQRVLLGLGEVLGGDEALEPALLVNERELLDLVGGQLVRGFLAADADVAGDERHLGHDVADQAEREVGLPARSGCRGW